MENKDKVYIKEDKENVIKWLNFLKDEIDGEYGSGVEIIKAINYAIEVLKKVEK